MNHELIIPIICALGTSGASIFAGLYLSEHEKVKRLKRLNQELKEKNDFIQEQTALIIREVRLIKDQYEKQTK